MSLWKRRLETPSLPRIHICILKVCLGRHIWDKISSQIFRWISNKVRFTTVISYVWKGPYTVQQLASLEMFECKSFFLLSFIRKMWFIQKPFVLICRKLTLTFCIAFVVCVCVRVCVSAAIAFYCNPIFIRFNKINHATVLFIKIRYIIVYRKTHYVAVIFLWLFGLCVSRRRRRR